MARLHPSHQRQDDDHHQQQTQHATGAVTPAPAVRSTRNDTNQPQDQQDGYIGVHGEMLSVERFGASAPAEILLREYGFTVDNVCARTQALLTG